MNKFLFKSTDADFQKLLQLTETVQKNVLYCTHRLDWLIRELKTTATDKSLQKQVDDYFEGDDDYCSGPDSKKNLQDSQEI